MIRHDFITDEHLEYLDDLRDGGDTNMCGAGQWLQECFVLPKDEASKILRYWMKTFGDESR